MPNDEEKMSRFLTIFLKVAGVLIFGLLGWVACIIVIIVAIFSGAFGSKTVVKPYLPFSSEITFWVDNSYKDKFPGEILNSENLVVTISDGFQDIFFVGLFSLNPSDTDSVLQDLQKNFVLKKQDQKLISIMKILFVLELIIAILGLLVKRKNDYFSFCSKINTSKILMNC